MQHVFLVDGSGFIFRAFHALPPMTRADGTPVNAVYGFCSMLMKLLEDTDADHQPQDLPHRHLSRIQGAPPAAARRVGSSVRFDPRGCARLQPALHRTGRL